VNIYEVEGTQYRYIFYDESNGYYRKSTMYRQGEINPTEDALLSQTKLNQQYKSAEDSPLGVEDRRIFTEKGGHPFFPVNPAFRIEADFKVFKKPEVIGMKTSTSRIASYSIYGEASLVLNGEEVKLLLYRNQNPKYADHLFLPFTDLTNGEETYGGGRYIDLEIPGDTDKIVIDFNKAYQPYCAYTYGYSCPIPPQENTMTVRVEAGVKHLELSDDHH
ncbi:MAG: DUF1684 domain-containing protein, partial [Bacteroidota bacterium]